VEECDADEVCEFKQYFDSETHALKKTSRDCNERWKCNPGCVKKRNGEIRCERCCDKDFCNDGLIIPVNVPTKLPRRSPRPTKGSMGGLKCHKCRGRDEDCLDKDKWEVEECDADEVCEFKQYFDSETHALQKTSRNCNERRKCRPGCFERFSGGIRCEKCCDKDFCNDGLSIPVNVPTKSPKRSPRPTKGSMGGLKCYRCKGRDKECLEADKWDVEECRADEVCEFKQYFDSETHALKKTSRDCNERRKCEPGCVKRRNGEIRCETCCDKNFCNDGLSIPIKV